MAKFEQVLEKAQEDACKSLVEHVEYIYNDGKNIKIPQNPAQLTYKWSWN